MRHIGAYFLILTGLLFLFTHCEDHRLNDPESTIKSISIDVRSLFEKNATLIRADGVSVIDRLAMTVTEADGQMQQLSQNITLQDSIVVFDLEVFRVTTSFRIDIFSNNSTLLYQKSASLELTQNDFNRTITMEPQDAVLAVSSSMIDLTAGDTFSIFNLGVGELSVYIDPPRQDGSQYIETVSPTKPATMDLGYLDNRANGTVITFSSRVGELEVVLVNN